MMRGTNGVKAMETPVEPAGSGEILAAIRHLHADLLARLDPPSAPPPAEPEAGPSLSEVQVLKTGLRALSLSIQQTKMEIAALRHPRASEDRIVAVTGELDAIVSSTEGATNDILECAEGIDQLATGLRSHSSQDPYLARIADDITDLTSRIFESCNFQDITGQRITKVVSTLKFIEERVMAMIDIWGADEFADLPVAEETGPVDEERKLLNGPALENQGISQDEIDKLFG